MGKQTNKIAREKGRKAPNFYEIKVRPCYDWTVAFYTYILCCCRTKEYTDYKKNLNDVKKDVQTGLNLLTFFRRLRMHGFALTSLFDKPERMFIASRALNKPIDQVRRYNPQTNWQVYERLLQRELLAINIFK